MLIGLPPESRDDEARGARAHFLQVFLSQRAQMEALVNRRVGCRATAADLVRICFCASGGGRWCRSKSSALICCAAPATSPSTICAAKARTRVNEGWQPDEPDSHGSEPQAALEAGNDLRHVEAALRALPERTRQIFLLNRIHGRKYAEIAKAMGLSQSAVEKHMMRALEACKASLRDPAPRLPGKAP